MNNLLHAEQRGYIEGFEGEDESENPYQKGTEEYNAWAIGHGEGRRDYLDND
jgi:ribosome modulation factor